MLSDLYSTDKCGRARATLGHMLWEYSRLDDEIHRNHLEAVSELQGVLGGDWDW